MKRVCVLALCDDLDGEELEFDAELELWFEYGVPKYEPVQLTLTDGSGDHLLPSEVPAWARDQLLGSIDYAFERDLSEGAFDDDYHPDL